MSRRRSAASAIANSVTVSAGNSNFVIPSLVVQRAETTVELGSGQSFAIAGLLQDRRHAQHQRPAVPGRYAQSSARCSAPTAFNRQQTELVILVTPFIVHPVNDRAAFRSPDDDYTPPGELDRLLFLHQTGTGSRAYTGADPGRRRVRRAIGDLRCRPMHVFPNTFFAAD